MKNCIIFVLLALLVHISAYAQITEITRLPVQEISQSIKESAPVWLTENKIVIFYISHDNSKIFSTTSLNRGISWDQPKVVQEINLVSNQESIYLSTLLSSSGRIILAWSVKWDSMKIIFSDDEGETWSQPLNILGGGSNINFQRSSEYLNLTQWTDNTICLSFSDISYTSYYKVSFDDGVSWSLNAIDFPIKSPYQTKNLSIISIDQNNLIGFYDRASSNITGVYMRFSSDFGLNWSQPQVISDEIFHERRPRVSKLANGNILVVYQRDNIQSVSVYGENDIYFKISLDNGSSWSTENRLTKYIGEDREINLSTLQNKTFITFGTERYSASSGGVRKFQTVYGVLQESVEKFTPPKVFQAYVPTELIDINKKQFVYRAKVIDDEKIGKVFASMEDSAYIGEMFDDGLHYDEEAGDSIFGNIFPFVNSRNLQQYSFDVNKIEMPMNNAGVLADVNVQYDQRAYVIASDRSNNSSVFYSDIYLGGSGSLGKFESGGFLYSGGFFISGYADGDLFSNGVATATIVEDYQPGKVGSLPDDPKNFLYVIRKSDVPFGYSWRKWNEAVQQGADFYDGDKDGFYNPVDKNLNGTWDLTEDMPPIIGDEIVWCTYNDGVPANERRFGIEPMGIEIQQTLFASSDQELENVVFIKYKIVNSGLTSEVLDSVYFGIWEDTDIGDATDDIVGCDTILQSGFYYAKTPDGQYGSNPPSFFTTLLQGPIVETNNSSDTAWNYLGELLGIMPTSFSKNLSMTSHTNAVGGDPYLRDPNDAIDVKHYLQGKTRFGEYPDPCNFSYGEVRGGVNCDDVNPHFWFSGDPVSDIGWMNTQKRDHRNFVNAGPFKLEKDKPQEIIIAYVIGRGTDPINSVIIARENVQRAIEEYISNFATMTYSPPPATNPVVSYVLYQNYPNPFNPTTTIRYELPQDGVVTIEIFDILGQKVKTILNEFKRADRYEVTFNSTVLASGVYIYQLRVNEFITSKKMLLLK